MPQPSITVIIPTVADERRGETIWRAIASAGPGSGAACRTLVVVNGNRFSPALVAALRSAPDVEVAQIEPGSLPLALAHGRCLVDTEFFAFLDDDDEYLPGGLLTRLNPMRHDPSLAFVVSNGWECREGTEIPRVSLSSAAIEADPLGTLLEQNWMSSAAGLYRTSMVSSEEISSIPAYLEWTYLGFLIAGKKRFRFLEQPTFRLHDTLGSVSKSYAYRRGVAVALERILVLELPPLIRRGLRRKLGAAHHALSTEYLSERRLDAARRHHWQSLHYPGGLRYLAYSRKLLFG